jgi:hypothetical protein
MKIVRKTVDVEEQYCEACRTRAVEESIESDEPEQRYQLCSACAHRLQTRSLRPSEWFRLAVIHGPWKHLLHDDFYAEDGAALVPAEDVVGPADYPAPTLDQVRSERERLIDFAMAQHRLRHDVIKALQDHDKQAIIRSLQQRVSTTHNYDIECQAYEICARVLGRSAEDWIRERWGYYRPFILFSLAEASAHCLPADEGFQRVVDALNVLPFEEMREQCNALAWFRSQHALTWLQHHVESPIVGQWGHLAALSQISWSWIHRWLEQGQGRPMSLVALDALINCCRYNTPMLNQFAPQLQHPAPLIEMKQHLEAYAAVDQVPRVEQNVRTIIGYWEAEGVA